MLNLASPDTRKQTRKKLEQRLEGHVSVGCDELKWKSVATSSLWRHRFGCRHRSCGLASVCTKTRATDRTVCSLFLFPEKPYCYGNMKSSIKTTYFTFTSFSFLFCFFFNRDVVSHFLKLSSKKRNAYLFILCLNTFYFFTVEMLQITCLCRRACMGSYCTLAHSYIFKWDYKYTISRHLVLILVFFSPHHCFFFLFYF